MLQILQHFQAGDTKSSDLIVFLQGWPDNADMWNWINWKDDLSAKHLLFINFPNTNGKINKKWGKDFPQLVLDLKATIDSVKSANQTSYLVAHDWGCFYGYMFDQKYPGYFKQMIMMDVPGKVQLTTLKQIIYVIIYQMVLTIAFLIGGSIGKYLTRKTMSVFKHKPPYIEKITSYQNYPYYYLWRNTILSALKMKQKYLKKYNPSAPVNYLYAGLKPFQFHGQRWIKMVQMSGGEVHKMEAGHWFMKKYAKFITEMIIRKTGRK